MIISKPFITAIGDDIDGLNWVEQYGGLTILAEIDGKKIPLSDDANAATCQQTGHYSMLLPTADKKGVVYFEEVGRARITPASGSHMRYEQRLRMIAWINLKENGYPVATTLPFQPIMRAILKGQTINMPDGVSNILVGSMDELTHEEAVKIFARYNYEIDIYGMMTYPYMPYILEFELSGTINPVCFATEAGGDALDC